MKIKICPFCGDEVPLHRGGNAKFCSDECYYENKKITTLEATRKKTEKMILLQNEQIVAELFEKYQSNWYISATELIKRDFYWNINSGETIINGVKIQKLIRYGYTLYQNQTVQLWIL